MDALGRLLLVLGIGLAILGVLLILFSRLPVLKNFGKLPGDIVVQNDQFTCFAPLMSMLILSILASIILNVIARIISR